MVTPLRIRGNPLAEFPRQEPRKTLTKKEFSTLSRARAKLKPQVRERRACGTLFFQISQRKNQTVGADHHTPCLQGKRVTRHRVELLLQ